MSDIHSFESVLANNFESPIIKFDNSNGDMTINLSKDLATRLDDILAQNSGSSCPQPLKRDLHSIEKRDLTPELVACLTAGIVLVFRNIYGGAVAELRRMHQEGRVARRPHEAGALVGFLFF